MSYQLDCTAGDVVRTVVALFFQHPELSITAFQMSLLALQDTVVQGNTAGSAEGSTGLGGGIFMGDKCSGGACTSVSATLQNVTLSLNYAHLVSPPCRQPPDTGQQISALSLHRQYSRNAQSSKMFFELSSSPAQ